jgi:hypothetical protein
MSVMNAFDDAPLSSFHERIGGADRPSGEIAACEALR